MKDRWTGSGSMSRGTTATSVGSPSWCLGHLRGSGINKQGVLKRAVRLQTSRRYKDTEHAARRTVLSRSIRLQICSKRTSGREFQSQLCVSVGSAIGFFRALSDWGFRCLRASGEVDSGGRAKKLLLVWPSSERGDMVRASYQGRWRERASSERGGNGVQSTMGKNGGRRREEEEE